MSPEFVGIEWFFTIHCLLFGNSTVLIFRCNLIHPATSAFTMTQEMCNFGTTGAIFETGAYGIGWGSGSRNTENTGKYRSSIVLNIENVQYRNFNTIEYRKKIQYWSSIIPKKKFNISPHPTSDHGFIFKKINIEVQ